MLFFDKQDLVIFSREFGFIAKVFSFLISMLMGDIKAFYFAILILFTEKINTVLKETTRLFMGKKSWGVFGKGTRPTTKGFGGTYGMPSGHSQIATTFSAYWSSYLMDTNYVYKYASIGFLAALSLLVMYSRVVWERAHTVQQVIIGGLIGSLIGHYFYRIIYKKY